MSAEYGIYVYLFLFTVYFLETGIVICALLPGDSLIFVSGAASAAGILNPLGAFLAIRSVLVSEIPLHTGSVTFSAARYTTAPLNGLTNSKWQKRRHFLQTWETYYRLSSFRSDYSFLCSASGGAAK